MSFAQRCLRLVTGWLLVTAMVVESLCVMGAELAVSTDFESGSAVLEAIDHCRDERGAYRFRNDHHFVIAGKPTNRVV